MSFKSPKVTKWWADQGVFDLTSVEPRFQKKFCQLLLEVYETFSFHGENYTGEHHKNMSELMLMKHKFMSKKVSREWENLDEHCRIVLSELINALISG